MLAGRARHAGRLERYLRTAVRNPNVPRSLAMKRSNQSTMRHGRRQKSQTPVPSKCWLIFLFFYILSYTYLLVMMSIPFLTFSFSKD